MAVVKLGSVYQVKPHYTQLLIVAVCILVLFRLPIDGALSAFV